MCGIGIDIGIQCFAYFLLFCCLCTQINYIDIKLSKYQTNYSNYDSKMSPSLYEARDLLYTLQLSISSCHTLKSS